MGHIQPTGHGLDTPDLDDQILIVTLAIVISLCYTVLPHMFQISS